MVHAAATDAVFHALSNGTRRRVIERLSAGPATVSELAAPFDMQLPSFVQHLSVLERSRLVKSRKRGRVRTYELVPERLEVVGDWLTARRKEWEARLDRFRPVRQTTQGGGIRIMSAPFTFDPKLDFAIERFIDAPPRLVWEALTSPEHLREWYMPREWGRVANAEIDLRPGGIIRIDIAVGDGREVPNVGCIVDVAPMERLVWTSMLFPGYRPATFDDIPITAVITMQAEGTGTRYVFTALHRSEADFAENKSSGFYQGTEIAVNQLVEHVLAME